MKKCSHVVRVDVDKVIPCLSEFDFIIGLFLKGPNESKQIHYYCTFHAGMLLVQLGSEVEQMRLLTMVAKT